MGGIQISDFGVTKDGDNIKKYTLSNANGMMIEIINYGGIVTSLTAPDRNGNYEDVVLGFANKENYFNANTSFYGAIIGRYANRIADGKFTLNGKEFYVNKNNGENNLHGGDGGFHTKVWTAEPSENSQTLKLSYTSKDGDEGFPAEVLVNVFYTLTDENALEIQYEATADQDTIINLSQHSYFNLSGDFNEKITDHELQLNATQFIPIDHRSIPLGNLENVENTPFDFRVSKQLGRDIDNDHEQLKIAQGYDHCMVPEGEGLRFIGELYHPKSGRNMEVITDQVGVQLYTGNFLDAQSEGKSGGKNHPRTGICLETQHFPDSPNRKNFPSVVLKAGEKYSTKTIYKFTDK
ncbi:aldose epimerase family protein [Chryseobacterium sp. MYb264]|uniref:aldose epimerase family protein n=1 Tax=Chryseobacterium sp. MYb264 TaxID=2745153 RepID=UPI002E107B73|nr:aldose epimerase family protein [Chryseobacterium sp. MYb264]